MADNILATLGEIANFHALEHRRLLGEADQVARGPMGQGEGSYEDHQKWAAAIRQRAERHRGYSDLIWKIMDGLNRG